MIDAHCHVDMYKDPKRIMDESERLGIITLAMTNLPSHFELGYPHFRMYRKVRLALGMHPLLAESHEREFPRFVKNFDRTSYIGEVGLDYSREGIATKEIQIQTYRKIITMIAGEHKLVSIHSRRAEREVFEILSSSGAKSAVFHWYSGPLNLINAIADQGYLFSVNPAMLSSKHGREIIERVPRNSLLTESDGPFATLNGIPAEPSSVHLVYEHLSRSWNTPKNVVANQIAENFKRLLSEIS